MQRRDLLKGTGALATLAVGGTGLAALSGGAGAATTDNFTIDDATPVTTTDGTVEYVQVTTDHHVVWTGFDVPVAAVAWTDTLVKPSDNTSVVVYDNTSSPVRLADFSSKDSGSDGWGGAGEYASEDPSSYVQATGPTKEGFIHANIDWRVLTDGDSEGEALSVETPGRLDDFGIEEPTDAETRVTTLEYQKKLTLYKDDGGSLVQMGEVDGTYGTVDAVATFDVEVTNKEKTTDSSGDGTSSTGT